MNAITLFREQISLAHNFLEETMEGVTEEMAHFMPPGKANPLAAIYAHAICSEDAVINGIFQGGAPLFASSFEGKTGISEPQPLSDYEWAQRLTVTLPEMRAYAKAVHQATDSFLAGLSDDDLGANIDMSKYGMGELTMQYMLNRFVLAHIDNMTGEISCLKGIQGEKGYTV